MRHRNYWTHSLVIGVAACTVLTAAAAGAGQAAAQAYPSRPITIIVAFPAGGPSDTPARMLAERMRASLGQPVIVENVTGASGTIATGRVARAAGDGYTLILGNVATHVINSALLPLPYDVVNDFAPISLLSTNSQVIVARKTLPANNLKELIAWLRANPDKATFGTSGVGSTVHLSGVLFQKETGTRFGFVPYRGVPPTMQDLVAGQIDMTIGSGYQRVVAVRARQHQGLCGRESGRVCKRRPKSRRWTRRDCRASTCRPGSRCLHPRGPRRMSSPNSMLPWSICWPIPRRARGLPISGM